MSRTTCVVCIGIVLSSLTNTGTVTAGYAWTQNLNFPGGSRYDPAEFVIGNKGYVFTGLGSTASGNTVLWEFDAAAGTWTQQSSLPAAARYGARAFVLNGEGYVMTGWSTSQALQLNDLWKYNPSANVWMPRAVFPGGARYTGVAFEINGEGYFGTGYYPLKKDLWKYDPAADVWSPKAALPVGVRQSASSFSIGGYGYIACGSQQPDYNVDFNDVWQYDPSANTWTQKANFPGGARYGCEQFVLCENAFVGLGRNSAGTVFNDFYRYDAALNAWAAADTFPGSARWSGTSFAIGNRGYVGLGKNINYLQDFWEYAPLTTQVNYSFDSCVYTASFIINTAGVLAANWNFGDGSTGNSIHPVHSYPDTGFYQVTLVADYFCYTDTVTLSLYVNPDSTLAASFTFSIDSCTGKVYFFNNSVNTSGTSLMFTWNFGDGNTMQAPNSVHQYTAPGTYPVTLIANNMCATDSFTMTIGLPKPVSELFIGSDTLLCYSDTLLLNAGTGFQNYLWNNGSADSVITVTAPGIYWVEVSNGSCTGTDTIEIIFIYCNPVSGFTSSDTLLCEKGCLDFYDHSVNQPVSWQWFFPGASPDTSTLQNPQAICYLAYGTYDVTLLVLNPAGTDTLAMPGYVNIVPNPSPPIVTFSNDTAYCHASGKLSYQWYCNNNPVAGGQDSFCVMLQKGDYYCTITDTNGCMNASNQLTVGISEYQEINKTVVFPNPASEFLIFMPDTEVITFISVSVSDAPGRILLNEKLYPEKVNRKSQFRVNIASLPDGVYLARYSYESTTEIVKFIVQR